MTPPKIENRTILYPAKIRPDLFIAENTHWNEAGVAKTNYTVVKKLFLREW